MASHLKFHRNLPFLEKYLNFRSLNSNSGIAYYKVGDRQKNARLRPYFHMYVIYGPDNFYAKRLLRRKISFCAHSLIMLILVHEGKFQFQKRYSNTNQSLETKKSNFAWGVRNPFSSIVNFWFR